VAKEKFYLRFFLVFHSQNNSTNVQYSYFINLSPTQYCLSNLCFSPRRNSPWWVRESVFSGLHDQTQTHYSRFDFSGLVIGSIWQHTTHLTQLSIPPSPEEFEPVIPASERPQNHALDRSATGIDPTTDGVAKHLSLHNEIPLRLTTCGYLGGLNTVRLEKLVGNNVVVARSRRGARVAKLNKHHVKQMNGLCGDE